MKLLIPKAFKVFWRRRLPELDRFLSCKDKAPKNLFVKTATVPSGSMGWNTIILRHSCCDKNWLKITIHAGREADGFCINFGSSENKER